MITPEVQNYINQSRAAGMPDDQIRQTLVAQGWQQADLDQAFGTTAAPASSTGSHGKLMGMMFGILILVLLILGVGGYSFYNKLKQAAQNTSTPGTNNNNSNNGGGNTATADCRTNASLPSGYPSDIPVYPNSKLTDSTVIQSEGKSAFYTTYCSTDSASEIYDYYLKTSSPWNIRDPYADIPLFNQDPERKALVGETSQHTLIIAINEQKTITEISYQLIPKQ